MKIIGDGIYFDDGARLGSTVGTNGLLSVSEEGELHLGYDDQLWGYVNSAGEWTIGFTPAQRREIADYAIALWQKWRDG